MSSSRGNGRRRGALGGVAPGMRPVSEADRISIMDRLQQFQEGSSQQLTFEAGLSNHDRAIVHTFCKKMGFKSKSYGKGDERRVTVFKTGGIRNKDTIVATPISFSPETQEVLVDMFSRFPPSDEEGTAALDAPAVFTPLTSVPEKVTCMSLTPAEIAKNVARLLRKIETTVKELTNVTQQLPIAEFRDVITSTVDENKHRLSLSRGRRVAENQLRFLSTYLIICGVKGNRAE